MNPNSDKNAHEREPAELDCGISIKGLGKVFKVCLNDSDVYMSSMHPQLQTVGTCPVSIMFVYVYMYVCTVYVCLSTSTLEQ